MHVFHAQAFAGQPCESEEMEEPKWFDVAKIPYGEFVLYQLLQEHNRVLDRKHNWQDMFRLMS